MNGISLTKVVLTGAMSALIVALTACGNVGSPPARYGMVKQAGTGLQFGSVVEKNFLTDAAFHTNKKIKIRTRNTSGDPAFDLGGFRGMLESSYRNKGYEPTTGDNFGILIDVNVMYSGQIQTNLANEYSFLGAAAGGLAGAAQGSAVGTLAGAVAGATLGGILGSFVTDDTYIVIARVTYGKIKGRKRFKKRVTFSRSPRYSDADDDDDEELARGFRRSMTTGVSVFAGGRNTPQSAIAAQVRQRFARIVSDII